MQFTGQNFSYDIDRRLKKMIKDMRAELSLGLLGGYGSTQVLQEEDEAYSALQYTTYGKLYTQNMKSFLDNAIRYRIADNPRRPGSQVKGGKGLLKGRKGELGYKGVKGVSAGYVFGTDMRAQNLQFIGGILAVNNNGGRVKRGTYGLALGSHTTVKGQNGFCAGKGTVARYENQFAIGAYNVCYKDSVFEIGYGTGNGDRKTIFMVDGQGNVSAAGTFTAKAFMQGSSDSVHDDVFESMVEEIGNLAEINAKIAVESVKIPAEITKAITETTVVKPIETVANGAKAVGRKIAKLFG